MSNEWIALLVGIAVSSGIFALLLVLYPKLKGETQGYPLEAEIEAALLPFLFEAICAAYRLSEQAVDEGYERLKGMNKKEIADTIYALLPDTIGGYDLTLVKRIIPADRFEALVQDAFDRFDRFYIEHKAHFEEEFEKWKEVNQPPQPQAVGSG